MMAAPPPAPAPLQHPRPVSFVPHPLAHYPYVHFSAQVFRKIKCHDQVLISAIWHPIEPSRVATCSWDGTIKYWD